MFQNIDDLNNSQKVSFDKIKDDLESYSNFFEKVFDVVEALSQF